MLLAVGCAETRSESPGREGVSGEPRNAAASAGEPSEAERAASAGEPSEPERAASAGEPSEAERAASAGEPSEAERAARGEQIFARGKSQSGKAITAAMGAGDVPVDASLLPCAGCHGKDGRGRAEGGASPSNVRWEALSRPYEVTEGTGRRRPPYTDTLFVRAVTMGLDSGGKRLDPTMPRYRLTMEEAKDLTAYLRAIGKARDPGITDTALRIGVLFPEDAGPGSRGALARRAVLALFDEVNRSNGIFGRALVLTEAHGAAMLDEQPFAVTGVLTGAEGREVVRRAREDGIPAVGVVDSGARVPPGGSLFSLVGELPGEVLLPGAQPGDAKAGDAKTGDAKTGDAKTGDAKTGDAKTGDAKTGDAKTGDAKTGDAKTGDAKTGDAKAGEAKAGEAKAGEAKAGRRRPVGRRCQWPSCAGAGYERAGRVRGARERGGETGSLEGGVRDCPARAGVRGCAHRGPAARGARREQGAADGRAVRDSRSRDRARAAGHVQQDAADRHPRRRGDRRSAISVSEHHSLNTRSGGRSAISVSEHHSLNTRSGGRAAISVRRNVTAPSR
ncbi:MAG: c-type cytochrome [Polyangiaceae bacterium]